jgi:hypothetical protein
MLAELLNLAFQIFNNFRIARELVFIVDGELIFGDEAINGEDVCIILILKSIN